MSSVGEKEAEELNKNGNTAMKAEDFNSAIEYYTKALDIDPRNFKFLTNRATAYLKVKQYTNAERDASKATEENSQHTKAWWRLGISRYALLNVVGTKSAYQKVLDHGDHADAALIKSKILGLDDEVFRMWPERRDYLSAIAFYSEALSIIPGSMVLLTNRATCYLETKNYRQSKIDANAALQAEPTYMRAWVILGVAESCLKDFIGADEAYQQVLRHGSSGDVENFEATLKRAAGAYAAEMFPPPPRVPPRPQF